MRIYIGGNPSSRESSDERKNRQLQNHGNVDATAHRVKKQGRRRREYKEEEIHSSGLCYAYTVNRRQKDDEKSAATYAESRQDRDEK